eukprot:4740484-Pleurochrysis_carterae.AAC.1
MQRPLLRQPTKRSHGPWAQAFRTSSDACAVAAAGAAWPAWQRSLHCAASCLLEQPHGLGAAQLPTTDMTADAAPSAPSCGRCSRTTFNR